MTHNALYLSIQNKNSLRIHLVETIRRYYELQIEYIECIELQNQDSIDNLYQDSVSIE